MPHRMLTRFLALALAAVIATSAQGATLSRATLSVSDTERSLAFYRDPLGFEVSARSEYDTPAMRAMFGIPADSTPTLILLDGSDGQARALALVTAPGMQVDAASNRKNAPALVMTTTELDRIHRDMLSARVPVVQPPTALLDFRERPIGREAMYLDPDGVRVVLFEYAPPAAD